jgi:hypothetical protein
LPPTQTQVSVTYDRDSGLLTVAGPQGEATLVLSGVAAEELAGVLDVPLEHRRHPAPGPHAAQPAPPGQPFA